MKIKKEQPRGAKNSGLEKELEQLKLELEQKNHELEIEASLEKVRGVAMGMRKPGDLLKICRVLFSELRLLGFRELRNAMINIHDDDAGSFLNYDYSDAAGATVTTVLYNSHPATESLVKQIKKSNDAFGKFVIKGKELDVWRAYRKGMGEQDDPKLDTTSALSYYFYSIGTGSIGISTYSPVIEKKLNVLKRFRNVFDFAYRRYMDVAQAEEQAKEARIEASLERMRAVAMGMRRSEELIAVCESMYRELVTLGFTNIRNAQIVIKDRGKETYFVTTWSEDTILSIHEHPLDTSPIIREIYNELEKSKDSFYHKELSGKEFKDWRSWRMGIDSSSKDDKLMHVDSVCFYLYSIEMGHMGISTFNTIPKNQLEILKRFKNVFELSYRRYIDVAQAEAQFRESQIELALERVRARTMAMQKSDELPETSYLLFQQFKELGANAEQISIGKINEEEGVVELAITLHGSKLLHTYKVEIDEPFVIRKLYNAWKSHEKSLVIELKGKELHDYNLWRDKLSAVQFSSKDKRPSDRWIINSVFFSKGMLSFSAHEPVPDETIRLLGRFAGVFEGTYTRFLDLQKAEAQAHEAQIEASLERVRAKAMAMHNSTDLSEAAGTVFTELNKLGIHPIRSGFVLLTKESRNAKLYPATSFDKENTVSFTGEFEFTGHPVFEKQYESWQKKENYFPVLEGEVLKSYYKILSAALSVPYKNFPTGKNQFGSFLPFEGGFLFTWSDEPYAEKEINILERFKAILDLTIRRYTDLKTAEAQAREAKIEAALERVRFKAMAMHSSEDLAEANSAFYRELKALSITPRRCGVALIDKEKRMSEITTMNTTEQGESIRIIGHVKMTGHQILNDIFEHWLRQEEYHVILRGNEVKEYYNVLNKQVPFPDYSHDEVQHGYYFMFDEGDVYSWTDKELTEEDLKIYRRFTSVISLTYKRYRDLQQAEAQAREAKIEAALERVRSKAMAMHKSDDLNGVVALVFEELDKLNLGMLRCGIGILTKERRCADVFTTTVAGEGRIVQVSGDESMDIHPLLQGAYEAWLRGDEDFSYQMEGSEISEYYKALTKTNFHLPESQQILEAREGLKQYTFHAMFQMGALFAFRETPFTDEAKIVMKRFASVFNLTYTRFNDLQIAEQHAKQAKLDLIKLQFEKRRAENALTELRTTQAQLIQSEKMASLGELTAGIAHEIKNPLNFVNNFSDLSTDLVDEFVNATDESERKDIAEDLKKNLTIISEHGRRADSIVKNMLEHSRTGSGKKQPTDINQLCTEFFNLAYHGNRANIPDFNCEMKKDLAPDLPEINVVSQDISRVLLNLFNNAFYAVNEKSLMITKGYKPIVELITQCTNNTITISVKDNGNGIPNPIKGKIFEPFFTTKPAGQGTGLGLSLSYDIITKGHGGELKVETKEGEGSTFIIYLPVN